MLVVRKEKNTEDKKPRKHNECKKQYFKKKHFPNSLVTSL